MKIKKGDKVKILSGKDRGKTGKVLQVFPSVQKVSVEGLNLSIKHLRPRRQGEQGQRIEFPAPLNSSNLMVVCPSCGKASRVNYKYIEIKRDTKSESTEDNKKLKNKKVRICNKCKQTID